LAFVFSSSRKQKISLVSFLFKMLTRWNLLRRGYTLSQRIFVQSRPLATSNEKVSPSKKEAAGASTASSRSQYAASEISDLILRRLHFREQRGVVKALIIGSGIVVVSTVLFLYVFRTPLKNQTVAQVADVAKSSLEQGNRISFADQREHFSLFRSDSVKHQVNVLSQELIQNLLSDPSILSKTLVFLEHIMEDPSTKQTLIRLLQRLMTDRDMQQYVSEFTSRIIYDVMKKPETELQLGQLFRRAILQKDNQDALYILLKEFIDNHKTKELLTHLALEVTNQVLNDENVKIAATTFAKDVLNDTGLQEQSGDFAWNAVKHALKPKWFAAKGKPPTSDDTTSSESEEMRVESDFENSIILPPFVRSS
jgi:hypothetical protein